MKYARDTLLVKLHTYDVLKTAERQCYIAAEFLHNCVIAEEIHLILEVLDAIALSIAATKKDC